MVKAAFLICDEIKMAKWRVAKKWQLKMIVSYEVL
jgi:hypothetical protein